MQLSVGYMSCRRHALRLRSYTQVYVYRFIQLFVVAFALGTLFVKPRMTTTTLQVCAPRLPRSKQASAMARKHQILH